MIAACCFSCTLHEPAECMHERGKILDPTRSTHITKFILILYMCSPSALHGDSRGYEGGTISCACMFCACHFYNCSHFTHTTTQDQCSHAETRRVVTSRDVGVRAYKTQIMVDARRPPPVSLWGLLPRGQVRCSVHKNIFSRQMCYTPERVYF
jgi:hypothetical protein